ncbi:MAG: family 1 glycosylhydrolase [Elusimicrobiota bacterium]
MRFPAGFLWGASTSSYQIEGGNENSALAAWERKKGWEPCGKAADSWRLWQEDIRCLERLNLKAYRFSVEWSRVEPSPGVFDPAALARYAAMADALKRAGIRPMACLHHFSEPAWLFRENPAGWMSEEAPRRFLRFSERVVGALKESVSDWLTFNEPMVWLTAGYALGHFPPGVRRFWDMGRLFREQGLFRHVLLAHREAYQLIHREVPQARVSIAQNVTALEPATGSAADAAAVETWDHFMHRELLDAMKAEGTLDFLGINYYTRVFVRRSWMPLVPFRAFAAHAEIEKMLGPFLFRLLGGRRGDGVLTDMGWEIVPEGFERVLRAFWERYRLPILVTENGTADGDGSRRESYLRSHLGSMLSAMEAGVPVEGYLHWSLMDNYEWGSYAPKFGLFRVDRKTFERTPAAGAEYYARVAKTGEL